MTETFVQKKIEKFYVEARLRCKNMIWSTPKRSVGWRTNGAGKNGESLEMLLKENPGRKLK